MKKLSHVQAACLQAMSALACAAYISAAQAQTTSSTELNEMVITGTRVATPVTDVIADVTVIDRTTLDNAGQSSLRDVLSTQPGIQITTNGSYRSSTNIFLRGATNAQTIVLIDGLRVGSATSGGAALENLSVDRIERIEILRGAASALYGPDAVGGVIQIFTKEPTGTLEVRASLGTGIGGSSDGQKQTSASLRGGTDVLGYSLGTSLESARGISVVVNPANTGYNADLDGFKAASTDAKFVLKPNNDHKFTLSLLRSETNYQIDSVIPTSNPVTPNPLGLTKATLDTHSIALTKNAALKWDAKWLSHWKSSLVVGAAADYSGQQYLRASDGALGATGKFNTDRRQLTWQNDIQINKDILSVVLEGRSEAVDSSNAFAVTSRNVQSRLVSYAFNRAQWNSLMALRRDYNSQFGGFNNWALSGGYRLTDMLRVVSSVGTSFQAPTFNQLYSPLISGFVGNPSLLPQQNRATELGLKYQQADLALSAFIYENTIQGFIIPSTNVQSSLAVLRGGTLSADVTSSNTAYSVSYDYADPKSYSSTPASNDLRLVRVARNLINTRITHYMGDFTMFAEMKLSGHREDAKVTGGGREILGGYNVLNLGGTWKVQKNTSLMARINNVNNTQYMLANGYSMPGRNAFVSLNWTM
jgi:vitamin B12 transporter